MQGTPEKEVDWVFSPAHLRGPGENPLPPWAPGIPAILGLSLSAFEACKGLGEA